MSETDLTRLDYSEERRYLRIWKNPKYSDAAHGLDLWRRMRHVFPRMERAVDLGCGNGELVVKMNDEGIETIGIDIAVPHCLGEKARGRWRHCFIRGNIWTMKITGKPVDCVICTDVLEHLPTVCVPLAVEKMVAMAEYGVVMVANHPSIWEGMELHRTQKDVEWWMRRFREKLGGRSLEHITEYFRPNVYLLRWSP